jgi:hypothetical protein
MEYPHRRYLLYLLSRQITDGEVMHACKVRGLIAPTEDDLDLLKVELGPIPNFWRHQLDRRNTKLYRWLRDRRILDIWQESKQIKDAADFLFASDGQQRGPRHDFEHLLLLEWNIEKAREQIALKYGELRIPGAEVLKLYAHYFWNLQEMSQSGIFNYLQCLEENETQLAAYSGDLAATYGLLGLRQQIEDVEFYDNVIAFAHEQVQYARRVRGSLNGQQIMGIAALARVADDAIQARRELRTAGLGDTIKAELAAFRLRKRKRVESIPSYEDLVAQSIEEVDNVIDVKPKLIEVGRG